MSSGIVLRIERSSIHDGDGLRTVIFLKGCPLSCAWCSTPEGQALEITEIETKVYGYEMTADELLDEVVKDEIFFYHSGGGITFSGGEPLLQADFVADVMQRARSLGIDTAMESSMSLPYSEIDKILPHLDVLFADLKHIDPERHKFYTGIDNKLILDNISRVAQVNLPIKLIVRIPLVPGINDDEKTVRGMGKFLRTLKKLERVEILPYHKLGISTYDKMGLEYKLRETKIPSSEHIENAKDILRGYISSI